MSARWAAWGRCLGYGRRKWAESAAGDSLFERTGKVSFVQVLPHALQHVLAAFAGIVTPAIIIASVCGFTPQEEAAVIQGIAGSLGARHFPSTVPHKRRRWFGPAHRDGRELYLRAGTQGGRP